MKIAIEALFQILLPTTSDGNIPMRIVLPAPSCDASIASGVVIISHPAGDVSITESRFQSLLQGGQLRMLEE